MADPGMSKEQVALIRQAQKDAEQLGLSYEKIAAIQQRIRDGHIQSAKGLQLSIKHAEKVKKVSEAILSVDEQIAGMKIDEGDALKSIVNFSSKQLSKDKALIKEAKAKLTVMSTLNAGDQERIMMQIKQLEQIKKQKETMAKLAKTPGLKEGFIAASAAADELQSTTNKWFDSLPGGATLASMMGLDSIGDNIQKGLSKGFTAYTNAIADGASETEALSIATSAYNKIVALNPWQMVVLGIAAVAAAITGLIGLATKHEEKALDVANAMGVSFANGEKMLNQAYKLEASAANQLSSVEDILKVQEQVANEFGIASAMSGEVALQTAEIGNAFGYGAEQAGDLSASLMSMGASGQQAADAQKELAAELFKSGVNVSEAMADVTSSAKKHARYFKGNYKTLIKAAKEAAKMGVSLDTMANVADGLLDIESSLTAQFEFQAMTGKQLNLDAARRLALEGDIAGATREVLGAAGDLADLQALGPLEMKKLEEATGMTADEMLKAAAIQQTLPDATAAQIKLMEEMGMTADEIANMDEDALLNKLAQQQEAKKMQQDMTAMVNQMKKALLPLANSVLSVFSAISPILVGIGKLVGLIVKPFENMMNLLTGNTDEMSTMGKILAGILLTATALYGIGQLQSMLTNKELMNNIRLGAIKAKTFVTEKAQNVASKVRLGYDTTRNTLAKINAAMESKSLAQNIAINVQKAIGFARDTARNALAAALWVMEKGMLAVQLAINVAKTVANVISLGAVGPLMAAAGASIAAAIPAIFTGFGMIPFGLGIPLAIAAVAGLIALVASMSKGDDVISSPSGGSGYGSRVLFGPEGAISFNNKDTIVAGTDLGYKMNDGVIAPKGAIKVDDYAEGEPAEANVVELSNDAAKKLGFAVNMGSKGLLGGLFGGGGEAQEMTIAEASIAKLVAGFGVGLAAFVPVLVAGMTMAITAGMVAGFAMGIPLLIAGMTMAVTMGNVAAFMMTAPLLMATQAASITAGMIAGSLATALIPKAVLVMNPIIPTLETNPILIGAAMVSMMGGFLGSLFGSSGGKDEDPNDKIVAKLDEVIVAIQSMNIEMDGAKVGVLTRIKDSFRRKG